MARNAQWRSAASSLLILAFVLNPALSLSAAPTTARFGQETETARRRWQARDGAGRPVILMRLTWANENEFLNGIAIVYSPAEAGEQARLVATTGIVKNHPLYVPDIMSLPNGNIDPQPGNCRAQRPAVTEELAPST